MREKIRGFLDNIFDPPISFLEMAIDPAPGSEFSDGPGARFISISFGFWRYAPRVAASDPVFVFFIGVIGDINLI